MATRLLPAAVAVLAPRFRPETQFYGNFRPAGSDDGDGEGQRREGVGGRVGAATGVGVNVWLERVPEELIDDDNDNVAMKVVMMVMMTVMASEKKELISISISIESKRGRGREGERKRERE